MTEDEGFYFFLGGSVAFFMMLLAMALASRSGYRNGVHDGYRYGIRPWDEIHRGKGIVEILKSFGEKL